MARQNINYGTNPNDGTGDTLRAAMDKVNDNFIELYNNESQANDETLTSISIASNVLSYVDEESNTTDIDLNSLLDNTNMPSITLGLFDTTNGELSLIRDDSSSVVIDLDGRYLTYSGQGVPLTSVGASGDIEGDIAFDDDYMYYCTADYDGSTAVWKRTALSTW